MKAGTTTADVRRSSAEFLDATSEFCKVPACGVRVLAARPLRIPRELVERTFRRLHSGNDADPRVDEDSVRKEVTSFGTFLSSLCHEFCHHLEQLVNPAPDKKKPELAKVEAIRDWRTNTDPSSRRLPTFPTGSPVGLPHWLRYFIPTCGTASR